jgi:peptide/nickel transport system permease protein
MGSPGLAPFVARRLVLSIPVVVLASVVTFGLVAVSGDPLSRFKANPHVHREAIERRERLLHLDRPIPVRYVIWAGGLLRGDLGRSVEGRGVGGTLWRASGVTARLVGPSVFLALMIALAGGAFSAARHNSWGDHVGTVVAFLLLSMPVFWLGWILCDVAVHLNEGVGTTILFFVGERSAVPEASALAVIGDRLRHLVLPVLTLALVATAGWTRYLRSSMLDTLSADHVRTARAKGLPEWRVVSHHALRTSLVPLTTVVALGFAGLVGGTVVVERVFSWPGLGQVLLQGLQDHDVNLVAGWFLIASLAVVVLNLMADIVCAVLDPRTRLV